MWLWRLALAMHMPLGQLLHNITSDEIAELQILDRQYAIIPNPWLQTGVLCAILANCHRGENQKAFTAEDFMPVQRKKQSNTDIKHRLLTFATFHNARNK